MPGSSHAAAPTDADDVEALTLLAAADFLVCGDKEELTVTGGGSGGRVVLLLPPPLSTVAGRGGFFASLVVGGGEGDVKEGSTSKMSSSEDRFSHNLGVPVPVPHDAAGAGLPSVLPRAASCILQLLTFW